ncbi:Glucose--fructose oxidoreductase [Aquicella siphonis]|uniref:Glucose--fructose oxidoreductase n=1 Tax=Aquicella siphonis TaxID=254247 RepID=A0A5E4PKV4_9COXI|nr:Gfo/Idh/MocA family oxidoreductase [Aquicella siphonis]VVC77037.1 Glucose--fructose oxidoreductase [Aquicella siphonis]
MARVPVKWGILGTSMISATMAKAIRESSISELYAVGSRSLKTAMDFAHTHNIPRHYSCHQDVLDDPEVDVVYIGLPNHLHKEWIVRCAASGKHILCEKPFVTRIDDARTALAAVQTHGVFCMEALMYRCHPLINKLKEVVSSHVLGKITLFNAVYMADIVDLANPVEGGAILNLGCYPVSLIRLLAGSAQGKSMAEPLEITSLGRVSTTRNDNQGSLLMKFENDMLAMVTAADDISMCARFEIIGTKGSLRLISNPWLPDRTENSFIIHHYQNGETVKINVTAERSLYTYQIDAVSRHVLDGADQCMSMSRQDTLGNMMVLDTWRQQIARGTQPADNQIMERIA